MAKKATGKNQLTLWDKKLAEMAAASVKTADSVGTGGNFLSTRSGVLKYQGSAVPGSRMKVVVLDWILENADYENDFDPDNTEIPRCFAFGRDKNEMRPHEKAVDPQADSCGECEMNEFGTAKRGKGKHCGNKAKLALITEGDLEDIGHAEVAYLRVPVTSVKLWTGYVKQTQQLLNRPPLGVITEIVVSPDDKNQVKVEFAQMDTIDDGEQIEQLIKKCESIQAELVQPYVQIEAPAPKPAKNKKFVGKAKAARK